MPQRRNSWISKAIQGEYQGAIGHIVVLDQKAQGTVSGAFEQDAWRTRTLNTLLVNTAGASLPGSNVLRLLAGIYEVRINPVAYNVDRHKARLYNVTTDETVLWGMPSFALEGVNAESLIVGRIFVPSTQDFRIEHYCQRTNNTNGFGIAYDLAGAPEIFLMAELHKVG